ncbi:NAD-dependent SIR2 family protein deacetylase [Dyadobacter sp. BE34]|uniref:NAD-dependent SIR2 family protein deacetylase n=1 Tax=Dyadobacter fermentans TaxID=94254 RepID=A0ABU1R9U1_9BACT|nr:MULTISPECIES: SIR2 family protein [Dyadobacter]MDR6809664.1 NAD-dependent SIR2 family protein deacetylase [Dyadobacter fermentans]MDR7047342.1 NAD-dependent SIR2 family protein deacetylase [Dyadobacter sp. BE242]MDR7201577.1 NAD-dependent SIR2 family protein deacetylase [Dyadobacter sp. BE34]MDR7219447.1 NAD-dependent SIR2 family protein deacetylase [Dyadobacter sp. BE31]MDR7267158.1 NAD-dependent SIR2 family protein deacetylase [Dyadobacter sp. BE32]
MYKESLFQLIRNEEVVLWAGAGMSMYAGYPSGVALAKQIYIDLPDSQRTYVNENMGLAALAEEYRAIKGTRNGLIALLTRCFHSSPKSIEYHQKVSQIPHFKTIITTNYDRLFETAYGENAQLIFSNEHVPYIDKDKVQVFKVHGDLTKPDSIILTTSDYNNFFKSGAEQNLVWTVVKERVATKNILFIGYNLADPNVDVIFSKITDALGENKKECFLVSPSLPPHKVVELQKRGIHFIESSGEAFIDELIGNIDDNIYLDLDAGLVDVNTLRKYVDKAGHLPQLAASDNKYRLQGVSSKNEQYSMGVEFSMRLDAQENKALRNLLSGNTADAVTIPKEILLASKHVLDGITVSKTMGDMTFSPLPTLDSTIDIRFEEGLQYDDVGLQIFPLAEKVEVRIRLRGAFVLLEHQRGKGEQGSIQLTFSYKHDQIVKRVREEVELFTFLCALGEGKKFHIFHKSRHVYTTDLGFIRSQLPLFEFYLSYFSQLQQIERLHKVIFQGFHFDEVDEKMHQDAHLVIVAASSSEHEYKLDKGVKITFELTTSADEEEYAMVCSNLEGLSLKSKLQDKISIHGLDIPLGFASARIVDPYIANDETIATPDGRTIILEIKSRSGTQLVKYNKTQQSL